MYLMLLFRFHTTQYDLNIFLIFHFYYIEQFPYYIVRFKPGCERRRRKRSLQFPYYIVRFKHYSCAFPAEGCLCFHTTQYDLNQAVGAWRENLQGFPYYIVRFKHLFACVLFLVCVCFHTTQYDLNFILLFFSKKSNK